MSSNEAGDPVVRLAEGFCYMSVPKFDNASSLSLVHPVIAASEYLARILYHEPVVSLIIYFRFVYYEQNNAYQCKKAG